MVVWIEVGKLDESWQQSSDYIGAGGSGAAIGNRYEKFGEWLVLGKPVGIPSIGLADDKIEFIDGRHRFAWFRDHGLMQMPVHVNQGHSILIKSRFGASPTQDWPLL